MAWGIKPRFYILRSPSFSFLSSLDTHGKTGHAYFSRSRFPTLTAKHGFFRHFCPRPNNAQSIPIAPNNPQNASTTPWDEWRLFRRGLRCSRCVNSPTIPLKRAPFGHTRSHCPYGGQTFCRSTDPPLTTQELWTQHETAWTRQSAPWAIRSLRTYAGMMKARLG